MKKQLLLLSFLLGINILLAQMPSNCELYLKKLIQSSSHYKKRFGKKDIFLDKKWKGDASSDGYNLTFTLYYENTKVEVYNRIITYQLDGSTKKLYVKDSRSEFNSLDVAYDKKLLLKVESSCGKKPFLIEI